MQYFARSENDSGYKETVQHHLCRTKELCGLYAGEFDCRTAGQWMGILHDFGKYSENFQQVLQGTCVHVDHALPGAAFLCAKLCGKKREESRFWPLVAAVRSHHGQLQYYFGAEIVGWQKGGERSPDDNTYSILSSQIEHALSVFSEENVLPNEPPILPELSDFGSVMERNNRLMMLTRMLFSALTDADYSASAEHFNPDYLQNTSVSPMDPVKVYEMLSAYRAEISRNSTADPSINELRNHLYRVCDVAGQISEPGLYTLTAPTGTGKTLAMLAFGLQQMICKKKKRIIVVLPYLSIIEQNAAVYKNMIPDILEDHSQAEREGEFAKELSQRWDAPFIITTSVKFFESLFSCNGPACRKLHHLTDSVILFDEAQSLPVHLAETTLSALSELVDHYHATVVFSTATQPDFSQLPGVRWTPQELVDHTQDMFEQARRVTAQWNLKGPIGLDTVANEMAQNENACVIVNLRAHAQKMFDFLCSVCNSADVYLMTTDLCPAHRTQILNEVREKLRYHRPCYMVATQCIEAGVDISFDVMYRALAPLESIIQAAGRCNRSDATKRGKFSVFLPDEEKLYPDDFYRQASNAVLTLIARHEIDLNDLSHIQEYYKILYGNGQVRQKKELSDAIKNMDFHGVAKAYRLIEDNQLQILVPCPGKEDVFQALAEEGREFGVTAAWMRRAAPYTVHSYQRTQVYEMCEQLFVYTGTHRVKNDCNWYILSNPVLYHNKKGLQLSAEFNGII